MSTATTTTPSPRLVNPHTNLPFDDDDDDDINVDSKDERTHTKENNNNNNNHDDEKKLKQERRQQKIHQQIVALQKQQKSINTTHETTTKQQPKKNEIRSVLSVPTNNNKKYPPSVVLFDEIRIYEFPMILGDHPAVSSGCPVTIGWKPMKESVVDIDFYEYCRSSQRKPATKKLLISVRRRANMLLSSGYSIEQIAGATLEVERVKKERADSLKSTGWTFTRDLLTGAVETTGVALKRVDVFGVGGVVVGAVGGATRKSIRVGTGITTATGKLLVSGVQGSSRAVTGVATNVAGGVVKAGTIVTAPVVGGAKKVGKTANKTGKAVTGIVTTTVTSTGKAVTGIAKSTGRVLAVAVSPITGGSSTPRGDHKTKDKGNKDKSGKDKLRSNSAHGIQSIVQQQQQQQHQQAPSSNGFRQKKKRHSLSSLTTMSEPVADAPTPPATTTAAGTLHNHALQ